MAVDTKPNLSNEKFEQYSGETLNLSGSTEIFGTFTINEQGILSIQSNCGDGKVLTSDADGIATWQELVLSSGENITKEITQSSHGFSVGDVVGWSGGTYNLAIADGTYDGEIIGIVSAVPDTGTFCVTQAGFITGLTGLETSCTYFLSDSTNGLMTATEPTDDGHISKSVFVAASTSSGWVLPYVGYVLSSGTTVGFINACNGLSDDGVNVCLGGSLTENTTINLATYDLKFSGDSLQYNADYSATYVPRSIPDVAYVTGLTSVLTTQSNFNSHTGDTTIHFTMDVVDAAISAATSGLTSSWSGLTGLPSENSDLMELLGDYTLTGTTAALESAFSSHTGDTSIHFEMSEITGYTTIEQFTGYTGVTAPATYLPFTMTTDMDDPTGFVDGSNITIAYNYTNRTITLTGDLSYYWKGVKKTLTSPWTSSAHDATVGARFLYSTDGTNFTWSQTPWTFEYVLVAFVYYNTTEAATFAVRETHGLMDYNAHKVLHNTIGTYLQSGGQATAGSYTENTATDSAVSPSFNAAVVNDEDLSTTISAWLKIAGYTRMYVSGSTSVYSVDATHPFTAAGADTYIQINDPIAGIMTAGEHNRYYNIYQILVPVTSDAASQKYRMIFLQPQVEFTSLVAAQTEDTRGLYLGSLTSASAEYVIYSRITYFAQSGNTNYGKVTIPTDGISYVYGTKMSALSVGGVSATNHANLSNLTWSDSGHLGTNDSFAAFDSSGNACNALRSSMGSFTGTTICATSCVSAPIICATTCVHGSVCYLNGVPIYYITRGTNAMAFTCLGDGSDLNSINAAQFYALSGATNGPTLDDIGLISIPTCGDNNGSTINYIAQIASDTHSNLYYRSTDSGGTGTWYDVLTSNKFGTFDSIISGDSSTTGFTINHALDKQFVNVQIIETISPYATIYTDVERPNANCIYVAFNSAPANGTNYCVLITG